MNLGDKKALEAVEVLKYCKGITDVSTISTDKKRASITYYEGFSADTFSDNSANKGFGYIIIPYSMSRYLSKELAAEDRFMYIKLPDDSSFGVQYVIIGEYKTKSEYDTMYVTYPQLSNQFKKEGEHMEVFVESVEIDVLEEKDLTKYIDYLGRYFADGNNLQLYEGKLNKFDEPYKYHFVHSLDMQTTPVESPTDTALNPTASPDTNSPSVYNNELNIITISRIDGNVNLKIPHMYADELIKG